MAHIILNQLKEIVGQTNVLTQPQQQAGYLTDWRGRYRGTALAIVTPQTTYEIAELIKVCLANKVSIIPQGGNTSLCGGATPLEQEQAPQIIINLSRMNKIISLDSQNNSITVEAGCTLAQIIQAAAEHNRYFPLSIASEGSCQIGGNIATNAGGIHVIRYGMMRNLVLGIEAVLPDGSVLNQLNHLYKNNNYLDLKQLFIGSEGTLGVISQAVLKLFPQPPGYLTGLIGVRSIAEAIELLNFLSIHFNICAFELIGKTMQNIYNTSFCDATLPLTNDWLILFEFETDDFDKATNILSTLSLDSEQLIISTDNQARDSLWHIRDNLPLAEKKYGLAIKHDISLPLSQIENFILANKKNIERQFPEAQIIIFGHLGDGNLHYNIQLNNQTLTLANEDVINRIVYTDVLNFAGSISAEHGIGRLKATWYKNFTDPISYSLARQIKQLLDPQNLFNPGKVFT